MSALRPRDHKTFVVCEDTGDLARDGTCPKHGGDACLIAVGWVGSMESLRKAAAAVVDTDQPYVREWKRAAAIDQLRVALLRESEGSA